LFEHRPRVVGEAHVSEPAEDVAYPGCGRQPACVARQVLGRQAVERLVAGRVELDPPVRHEEHAVAPLERQGRPLLGDENRGAEPAGDVEDLDGSFWVELRRRLVEDEQLRFERKHGSETNPLELTGRKRLGAALGQALGANLRERGVRPRPDLIRRRPDVLEPEGNLVRDPPEYDLVLGILEERGDRAGEVGRPEAPRVHAGDDDTPLEPPAVEVRDEARERAEERRLAGAGRSEHRHDLARLERERDVPKRGPLGVGVPEGEVLDLG
jgi:hypothetical protein